MSGSVLLDGRILLVSVVLVAGLALCVHQHPGSSGPKTHVIYWNISTDIFRIDNTDHIFDINKGNSKFEYDQINILCPFYQTGVTKDEDTEKYMVYNVTKEEYETCRITHPNPRMIAVCDKPFRKLYFTITWRPFSPQPGGLEFFPGRDYYFISTSSKDDLHRRIGGRCLSHNMKVLFKVWYPMDANLSTTTQSPPPVVTVPSWHYITPSDLAPPSAEDDDDGDDDHRPHKPHTIVTSTNRPISKPTKKVKPYDKHPNDVEKSSLTRSTSAAPIISSLHSLYVHFAVLIFHLVNVR